jgi:hypothetical protein
MSATLPDNHDLKAILEHVRGQFQYHAGQRLNTIRYYFVAYAIFVAAYVGTISGSTQGVPIYVRFVLALTALIVTLAFWGLERRNVQLVETDEKALKEIERLVADKYSFEHFEMTERQERPHQRMLKYGFIVPFLFLVFTLISGAAVIRDLCLWMGAR